MKLTEEKLEFNLIESGEKFLFFKSNYSIEDLKLKLSVYKDLNLIYYYIIKDLNTSNFNICNNFNFNEKLIKLKFNSKINGIDNLEFILYEEKIKINSIYNFILNLINQSKNQELINQMPDANVCFKTKPKDILSKYASKNYQIDKEEDNYLSNNSVSNASENFLNNLTINKNSCNNESAFIKFPFNFSKIIKPNEICLIKFWLNNKEFNIDLLYSSQIHGEKVETFHEKCDGISNTLVLIYTDCEKRIGGFSTLPWLSKKGYSKGVGEEFLFSLDSKEKFHNDINNDKSIYNNPDYFPSFGSGCDLNLYKDCFDFNHSYTYSNFQHSYGKNKIHIKNDLNCENYFTGKNKFRVIKMEVFQVNFYNEKFK